MPGGLFPRPRRKRAAIRVSVLRIGALRSSVNQGTARKASRPTVGSTEQRRLFAAGRAKPCLAALALPSNLRLRPEPSVVRLSSDRAQGGVESLRVGRAGPSAAWMPRPSLQGCTCSVSCLAPPAGSPRYPQSAALRSQLEPNKKPGRSRAFCMTSQRTGISRPAASAGAPNAPGRRWCARRSSALQGAPGRSLHRCPRSTRNHLLPGA